MKATLTTFLFTGLLILSSTEALGQTAVWHQNIRETSIDVRTNKVVLAEITIDVPDNGQVLVHFDGSGIPDAGDRLVLAASDEPDWNVNDGAVGIEIINSDINHHSFSHSRMYNVPAGEHTFYAIAHNWVEKAGSGKASIYGSLTVKYFSSVNSNAAVYHQGIQQIQIDVRGNPVVVAQQNIRTDEEGFVLVRFDGSCSADVGDRIVLSANDDPSWEVNDGNVACESIDSNVNRSIFSHSRMYPVSAGDHTFYAVAQNWTSQNGTGIASIYGSLTVEYYPVSQTGPLLLHQGISTTSIDVRTETKTLGKLTLDAPLPGKVIVHFDGHAYPDEGDRIVLAASDSPNWSANEGNVNFELYESNRNTASFSHTRVYDINFGGLYDYYAVANNFVEQGGNGEASIYGSLTVQYFPDLTRVSNESPLDQTASKFQLTQNYPNPFSGETAIQFTLDRSTDVSLKIYDLLGKEVKTLQSGTMHAGAQAIAWDGRDSNDILVPNGVYIYKLLAGESMQARQMTVIR